MNNRDSRMVQNVRYLFGFLVFGGLAGYLYVKRELIPFAKLIEHYEAIILSSLLMGTSLLAGGYCWILILEKMELKEQRSALFRGWFISQLGKYVPGKVWVVVSRLYLYPSDRNKIKVGYSILLELILSNLTGFFVFLCSLFFWDEIIAGLGKKPLWLLLMIPVCLLVLHPPTMESIVNKILRWIKREPISVCLEFKQILELFIYYIFFWCLYGMAFAVLASAFTEVTFRTLPMFAGMYILAFLVGFVSLISPSGLGVREGVLALLLSSQLEGPVSIYLSLVSRIWFTIIELTMVWFFSMLGIRKTSRGVLV